MDRLLQKEEKALLIKLLGISPTSFGNIPLMRDAYKRASKKYHPDKGGEGVEMTLLNSLWQRFQEGLLELRNPEVYSEAYGSPAFRERYREWCSTVFTNEESEFRGDLHCDESIISSEEEDAQEFTQESGYNSASFSATFPNTPDESRASSTSTTQKDQAFSESKSYSSSKGSTPGRRSEGFEGETPKKRRRPAENLDESHSSSQASFASTPPKTKKTSTDCPDDIPSGLFDFVSHAVFSNKTVNCFLLYSTFDKASAFYDKIEKFTIEFKSLHSYEAAGILFFLTNKKHRLSAVKNFCQSYCTVSFLICRTVLKPLDCFNCLCKTPFKCVKSNKPGLHSYDFDDKSEEACNWNKVADFAVKANVDDPLLILAHYLDFAAPFPCKKCANPKTKAHEFHQEHHANAVLFENSKSQRAICHQASDIVLAKRRLLVAECTRSDLLTTFFEKQLTVLKSLDEVDIIDHMAGVAWYACLLDDIDKILVKIITLITENVPKQRNILFKGPVNTGKTTLAVAIMDLLEGKSLNVNCPADKLNFELGCAIDKFAVVFEDVKGQSGSKRGLQPGQGVSNLDNLRDYLDGAVQVNLERKHANKRSQIFPPCIVTMNEYFIPETLFVRFSLKVDFEHKPNLHTALSKAPILLKKRVLQKGVTLFMLLMWYLPNQKFAVSLQEEIASWKSVIEASVSWSNYCTMIENIEVGESPLEGLLEEVPEDS
ncbi:large T antigen [Philantomba monticola polyomavirus 1]|uniref:Large T antigen n=1 Tax=Philantomba monticola polyomavirus 1 TaxID=2170411 RepID=A0A2S1CJJ1_9POLY|nr:large T antigen [Philantomba monticola polyomavirus 1]AWD33740.1 large T antigen [Philantomba monticola polyomavirus 1]